MFECHRILLAPGTNPVPQGSKNEGFATNDEERNPIESLAMGTRGLISNHMAENEHKPSVAIKLPPKTHIDFSIWVIMSGR